MSESFFFWLTALVAGGLAVMAVTTRHILRSAVYLMGVLSASAIFYLLLGAEYLAGIQILVYVGGIVVLLVFAIMLTRSDDLLVDHPSLGRKSFAALASLVFFLGSGYLILQERFPAEQPLPSDQDQLKAMGRALLDAGPNGYLLPFELISLLLLAVLIAGVVIARKETE